MTETMKSAMFESAGHMAIEDVAKPTIEQPDDAIVRVVRTCVCGSDLWPFRGINQSEDHSTNPGHEAIGIVEEVGEAITSVTDRAWRTTTTSRWARKASSSDSSTPSGRW